MDGAVGGWGVAESEEGRELEARIGGLRRVDHGLVREGALDDGGMRGSEGVLEGGVV